ncbi:putative baseplate assembly protein [Cryptosporangium phraense]|uniref:Putative baseplate assembly protein n=1 Tax=Cryptosporangium phraense TaxID=2593070 RepID=A0A545APX4_9ACTN|nr:putative baseplate assembly protein [Cryptosporangium phraense]TQS43387.1 putative baseplate assembly protein [Cryptosporangium phraense]
MTLPIPDLDDRDFADLVLAARERIRQTQAEWTDLSVHDPGLALIETFAYLTEVLIYRLNRLPEKAYLAFLNLLGVSPRPPSAAWADVVFTRTGGDASAVLRIPAGTRVAATRGTDPVPVVFVTTASAEIPAGARQQTVRMVHGELVHGELLGAGTGRPGQVLRTAAAPLVTTAEPIDLLLGVEATPGSVDLGAAAREFDGVTYEIWQPVTSFADQPPGAKVYVVDRTTGTFTFAPAVDRAGDPATPVAVVPAEGRQIRTWYRTGGGPAGNVSAGSLTGLRDPLPGVSVRNPAPAQGGRAAETLESAILRGPYEFFSIDRAVTARDYEILATARSSAIARARAFTGAEVYTYARPGEVEVVLVPYVPEESRPGGRLPADLLRAHELEETRRRTEAELDRRRPLGTACHAGWARYKPVSVQATVVVRPEEDADAVSRRVHDRVYQTLSPLPTPLSPDGWPFGEPLRASNVYRLLEQAEPGVRYVDDVRFVLEEAPDHDVRAVAIDAYQPGTWYAGSGEVLFRSGNAGLGWEPVGRFPGETVTRIVPAPGPLRPSIGVRAGSVALVTRRTDGSGSRLYVTTDLGETWTPRVDLEPGINDVAWLDRDGAGVLLLATDSGLFEVSLLPGAVPQQTLVDLSDADRGFHSVRAFVSERGLPGVAVASQGQFGVHLSIAGGRRGTFGHIGLSNTDVRTLAVQYDGAATWLFAGVAEPDPAQPGTGCYRTRLFETDVRWQTLSSGWTGGTCRSLAVVGTTILAGTQSGGALRLDASTPTPAWQGVAVTSGLPLRDRARFEAVETVAASSGQLLAGGASGVYRSDTGTQWTASANQADLELVTVPDTWLLCSGEHRITVVRGDATPGD